MDIILAIEPLRHSGNRIGPAVPLEARPVDTAAGRLRAERRTGGPTNGQREGHP
ncbi:hypothetical protein [Paracidovorax avenae]|uniref:hypothetical protein n=1 Tax=Paracidovorax avenae TaxID=80867 RepID=UPI001863B18E|nr:hypothetical protein [Paracidovorax avenae]